VSLSSFTKHFRTIRVRRKRQSKQQEQQRKHKTPYLKSLSTWVDFEAWRGFDLLIVSWSVCFCSCIECEGLKTWMARMVVIGGIYSPNHYSSHCCWWAHRTVRCVPRRPIVGVWSGWPLKSFLPLRHQTVPWHTGQYGGTPDSPVRSDFAVLTSALFTIYSMWINNYEISSEHDYYEMSSHHQLLLMLVASSFSKKLILFGRKD
jgi:hypothetical protein